MCNNVVVLYIFIFLKICTFFIIPIVLIIIRKKEIFKIILYINIILLSFFAICNIFKKNSCVLNSSIDGIKMVKKFNQDEFNRNIHIDKNYSSKDVTPEKDYKTYTGKTLYYYNQNSDDIKNAYYECDGKKIYMNSIGSGISALSTAVSTLFDDNINPVEILNYYKEDNYDMCEADFSLEDIYESVIERYGAITLNEISGYQVEESIKNGYIVIAYLQANENSKLTCDSKYIVIYSMDFDGKYMITDSTLKDKSYVCSYSSDAYSNIIKSDNMKKSWTFKEIDNEAVKYYMVKKG